MRHGKRGRHLNRNAAHRRSLFRNLSRALITHERIVTTVAKAKELRPFVEKLITLAKKAATVGETETDEKKAKIKALHYRRLAMAELGPTAGTGIWDKKDEPVTRPGAKKNNPITVTVLEKLFNEIGPRYKTRPGGYTRIVKQSYRRLGDAGETAIIELLKEGEKKVRLKEKKPAAPAPAPVAPPANA
ncbi:MAG TPA: 50S ribosomal protein L17 [Gemmataceae bacterium]|nr:50S ribosomal protein L17 [Gemmataceae bacterium]